MTFFTRDVGMICWMMIRSLRPSTDFDRAADLVYLDTEIVQDLGRKSLSFTEQSKQQVLCADVRVMRTLGLFLGKREHLLRPFGEALERVQNRLHCPSGPPVDGKGQTPGTAVTPLILPGLTDS